MVSAIEKKEQEIEMLQFKISETETRYLMELSPSAKDEELNKVARLTHQMRKAKREKEELLALTKPFFYTAFHGTEQKREDVIPFLTQTDKPIIYTTGFSLAKKHEVDHQMITAAEAVSICEEFTLIDVKEMEDRIDLHSYTIDGWKEIFA